MLFFFDLLACARAGPAIIFTGCPTPQASCFTSYSLVCIAWLSINVYVMTDNCNMIVYDIIVFVCYDCTWYDYVSYDCIWCYNVIITLRLDMICLYVIWLFLKWLYMTLCESSL